MALRLRDLRRILESPRPLQTLRSVAYPEPEPAADGQPQLWVVDARGLPPRPWRVHPDTPFDCKALGCKGLLARMCVARQRVSEMQRTNDTWRGEAPKYPSCQTERCAQGRGIRQALDVEVTWVGVGSGKRIEQGRRTGAQEAARRRLKLVGLLDQVRTLDDEESDLPVGG